jgi:hypothetical protein
MDKVNKTLPQKQNKNQMNGGVGHVVEGFPSKCKALGSIPSTEKGEKRKRERKEKRPKICLPGAKDHSMTQVGMSTKVGILRVCWRKV